VERFRRALFEGKVRCTPSLLLRSAFADAITLVDPAGNHELARGRSTGLIDALRARQYRDDNLDKFRAIDRLRSMKRRESGEREETHARSERWKDARDKARGNRA